MTNFPPKDVIGHLMLEFQYWLRGLSREKLAAFLIFATYRQNLQQGEVTLIEIVGCWERARYDFRTLPADQLPQVTFLPHKQIRIDWPAMRGQ